MARTRKGGVEGEVGKFRRTWLSPVPKADSLDELNARLQDWDLRDERRRITGKLTTVGQDYAVERELLTPLSAEHVESGLSLTPRVDHSALITIRQSKYSVPARLIGRQVRAVMRASEILVFDGRQLIARHERLAVHNGQSVVLDHYLEVLRHKPGALAGSTALARAREAGAFTAEHDAFWQASRRVNGDAAGTRELIEVLLLHRTLPAEVVLAGARSALRIGSVLADVVKVEARLADAQHRETAPAPQLTAEKLPKVVSLTQRRLMDPAAVIAGLPRDTRPLPSMDRYDQLLPKRAARTGPNRRVRRRLFNSSLTQVLPGFASRSWTDNNLDGTTTSITLSGCKANVGGKLQEPWLSRSSPSGSTVPAAPTASGSGATAAPSPGKTCRRAPTPRHSPPSPPDAALSPDGGAHEDETVVTVACYIYKLPSRDRAVVAASLP